MRGDEERNKETIPVVQPESLPKFHSQKNERHDSQTVTTIEET